MKVQLDEDGPRRFNVAGDMIETGDVVEVNDDLGEHLLDKPYFFEAGAAEEDVDIDEFDVDEWLDQGYQTRVERVEAGDVDGHLEEIAEAETSDNVLDAIGVRRAELEE